MSKLKESISYSLINPIKFGKDGKFSEGCSLVIKAPSPRFLEEFTVLEQAFLTAMKNTIQRYEKSNIVEESKRSTKQTDLFSDENAQELLMLLQMELDAKQIMQCYRCLGIILTSGSTENAACSVDGQKMTVPMWEDISIEDKKGILGVYLVNFIATSLPNSKRAA